MARVNAANRGIVRLNIEMTPFSIQKRQSILHVTFKQQ
ncbi:Catalase [Legionella pneumophila subsp. pneumophila LPE509]|nr:Catalase [Legionella pneumophila subsp. pneumophila LPE509]